MIKQCKYCLTEYANNHNIRLCYEYQYFIVCEKIDDLKDLLTKLYDLEENLRLHPEEPHTT